MKRYPIQDGPDVPWEVMAPFESMARNNHGQSLERLAERGGLGCAEAWAVVNSIAWRDIHAVGFEEAKKRWCAWADRINLHFEKIEQLESKTENLQFKLAEAMGMILALIEDPDGTKARADALWQEWYKTVVNLRRVSDNQGP